MPTSIGPGVESAYRGFFTGLRAVQQVQREAKDEAWQDANRDRAQKMWGAEDALRRQQLETKTNDLQDIEQVRPQVQELRTKKIAADGQKLDNTSIAQDIEGQKLEKARDQLPQALQDADIAQHLHSAQTLDQALTGLLELGGKAYAHGDTQGLTRVMGHLTQSGLINAGGMGNPVSSQLVNIPKTEGAVDFAGQPIAGQAIKITTDGGAEAYVNPSMMRDAYSKLLAQQDAKGAKMVKPGEQWVTPAGRVIARGEPRMNGGMYVDPDTNEVIDMRPRTGGAGGSGAGKGGKAPATPAEQAVSAFEVIAQKGEVKLNPDQIASGQVYAERAARNGLTANESALVAHDVAVNGNKVLQPYLDPNTLTVTGAYSSPRINGGRPVPLEPGNMTLQDFAGTPEGKTAGQRAVAQATEMYVRNTPAAQTPEQRKALTDFIDLAASDTATYDRIIAAQKDSADPAKLQLLQRLIDAKRVFGAAAAKPPAAAGAVPGAVSRTAPASPAAATGSAAPASSLGGMTNYRGVMNNLGAEGLRQAFSQPYAPGAAAEPKAASSGSNKAQAEQELQAQAASITPDVVKTMDKAQIREIFNNPPLMRRLSGEIKQQLQYRFSGVNL